MYRSMGIFFFLEVPTLLGSSNMSNLCDARILSVICVSVLRGRLLPLTKLLWMGVIDMHLRMVLVLVSESMEWGMRVLFMTGMFYV